MRRKKETEAKGLNPVLAVCFAVLAAYALTAVIFVVYAGLLTYTGVSEKHMQTVITCGVGAAVVLGGFLSAKAVKKRGIVWGVLTGLLYGAVMIVAASCVNPDFGVGLRTGIVLAVALCGGGLGGVLGVNFA